MFGLANPNPNLKHNPNQVSLARPVSEYVPLEALPVYDFGPRKVGSFQSKVW